MNKCVNPHQVSASGQEAAGNADRYRRTLELFSAAWSRGDVDTLLSLMGDEPVYKGSTGAMPGTLYKGREEVRAVLEKMAGEMPAPMNRQRRQHPRKCISLPTVRWFTGT